VYKGLVKVKFYLFHLIQNLKLLITVSIDADIRKQIVLNSLF
jgi:hypothetical protein